jgi:hypothetical protein
MHGTGEKYTKDEMDRIGGMHAWERWKVQAKFWSENVKYCLGDLGIDGP